MYHLSIFEGLDELLDYFAATYAVGIYQAVAQPQGGMALVLARAPLFPPRLWNVHDLTVAEEARTNNFCESWNNR